MTDDMSDPLAGAFAGFDDDVAHLIKPGDTEVIHRTVRNRRRVRSSALATLLALVVAAPLAYLNLDGEAEPPAGPARTPTSTTTTSPDGPEPGRLGMPELNEATIQIPAWAPDAVVADCPSGPLRFSRGVHQVDAAKAVRLEQVVFVDIDQDGDKETIARFSCGTTQAVTGQVLALQRDPAGGVRTFGQVFRQTGEAKAICDIQPGDGKYTVNVKVVSRPLPRDCETTGAGIFATTWGSFNYDWREHTFVKIGEPFSFSILSATP
ncbi:hypothetical protein [Dactylosporangium sp. NPDC048998]|uniref:hypothetical protein n=1 Tax=Dactylosporangium sp. NPDC048998 TaxID=3363976 RepID=UPI003718EA15